MRYQILRQKIKQNLKFLIMISNIVFLKSWLPDIILSQSTSMFVVRDIIQKILEALFLGHLVKDSSDQSRCKLVTSPTGTKGIVLLLLINNI